MSYMFSECSALQKINLQHFNTSKVIDMSYMFYNCQAINELNLSNFITINVTNMINMFDRCSNLNELDISNFDIKNDTKIIYMFSRCKSYLKDKIRKSFKKINIAAFEDEVRDDFEFFSFDFRYFQEDLDLPINLEEDNKIYY